MCGRFTLRASAKDIADLFQVEVQLELLPRFNIAPTQEVLAIRAASSDAPSPAREAVKLRWGLVPSWAEDPTIGNSLINARAETLATKPAFRKAFTSRRCLIVADGFYEWQKTSSGKQPFYVSRADGQPFAFAGLYERWRRGELSIESCTIVTTEANDFLRSLHHRMPVILPQSQHARWLDPHFADPDQLKGLLHSVPGDELDMRPVNPVVNRPNNDSPDCIAPFSAPAPQAPAAQKPTAKRSSETKTLFDLH
jgi:putative SOS response-associated peptidase YedK